MSIKIRPMRVEDVETCGRICYEAFRGISESHNFRPDFPNAQLGIDLMRMLVDSPNTFSVVAEQDGEVVGSNHLMEYDAIRAVGPITVDPDAQAKGVGRMLMEAVIERGKGSAGIRLVQDSFNTASLSLYAALGFDIKEPLALMEGTLKGDQPANVTVRAIEENDYEACAELCRKIHGLDRLNELKNMPPFVTPLVAVRDGRLTAYASAPHFWVTNHAVAETEDDMRALLIGAGNLLQDQPITFLLPTRQTNLFRWCLKHGMRVIKPLTLMAMGEYHEPHGCYLPSVGY
jgi:predicted N-acetyltransferase YhbS